MGRTQKIALIFVLKHTKQDSVLKNIDFTTGMSEKLLLFSV